MFHGIRNKRIPVLCRGRGPRTPAVLGFCALSVRFPPRRAGGLLALCALRSRRAQGPVAALPPRYAGPPLAPWLSSGLRAFAPSGAAAGGWCLGFPPVRVARSRRALPPLPAAAGGWLSSFAVGFLWGCPVSLSVPFASSVVRSARCGFAPWSGCALGVSFRPSARALSGFVAAVRFSCPVAAGRFAASWGRRLPAVCRGCCVRPVPGGFAVSVPVAPPPVPVGRGRASRRLASVFSAACVVA